AAQHSGSSSSSTKNAASAVHELPQLPELPQTSEGLDKIAQLEQEGEKYFARRELDKALTKWQEAYGLSLEMKYADGEGRALKNMCRLYFERGQLVKAKQLGENALEVLANIGDKRSLAKARIALAQVYFGLDNPVWAGQQLQLALQSFSDLGGSEGRDAAKAFCLAGSILVKQGKVKEALNLYQGAATYYGQAGDPVNEISVRLSLTGMMQELGWKVAASEEARKALDLANSLKNPELIASTLAVYAACQYALGEHSSARKSFEEALNTNTNFANVLEKATLDSGYAHALAATGDLEQAKEHLSKALAVLKTGASSFAHTQALNAVGNIEAMQGHANQALQFLRQALNLHSIISPKQPRFGIIIVQNLAIAESRSGDNRNARARLESALPVFKTLNDPLLEGRTYTCLAEVCLNLKDIAQAESYLNKGIAISQKINDDAALWRDFTLMAKIRLSQALKPQAKESLTSAVSFFRSPQAGFFPSPELLGFVSTREDLGYELVSLLVSEELLEPALLTAEQLKEESFIVEWHRRGGEVKPQDSDLYADLLTERAHLHAAEATTTPDKLLKDWKNWLSRLSQLAHDNRALARLIAPVPTTIANVVQEAQHHQSIVVDYLVGPHTTIAFTLARSGELEAHTLTVGRAELQGQVASLLSYANKPSGTSRQLETRLLEMLYSELFPPSIEAVLPSNANETIVILPDGILFNLPFAALIDGQDKYFIEKHTLTLASSLGVFLDSPPEYTQDLTLVVASGAPSSDTRSTSVKEETTLISSLFEPELVTKLTGKDVEISSFQEHTKGKAVVHFTNSVPLPAGNPLRSVLPFASGKEARKITTGRLFELTLPNDLFVWSSTSVSTKDFQGNAVKIFSRGLSYAGVRNIIMSLWVEPEPQRTAELIEFYKNKHKGLNQAQSLRQAQLLAMSKDPSPRTWAAFQLWGPGH
ncbi:MAG: CHAT domain-containing protein, partial [Candidatus Melainabacteria bacterium]|nr:CHAT domain-containing protein [Candidatus Melainabacteria bacterium]